MSDNPSNRADPLIAGMGMLELVEEVRRVRGQRDRLADQLQSIREVATQSRVAGGLLDYGTR